MFTSRLTRVALALLLTAAAPAAVRAQDAASAPEGLDWHLTSYADGERMVALPWHVDATFRLDGGTAIGSGGCNDFRAEYALAGRQLSFGPADRTERDCADDATAAVEDGYLAALREVVSWAMEDDPAAGGGMLHLYDEADEMVLTFELPVVGLTPHDVSLLADQLEELQASVERHEERLDNMRIKVLRDRIKALEAQAARSAGPDLAAFTAAERLLYQAMRDDIARTCEPRRSQNPAGTVAALQCRPETDRVRDMAVYLMEGDDAASVFSRRMREAGVKGGTERRSCALGKPSQMAWTGAGMVTAGCYRNEDGRANLRFTNIATKCRQLTAGDTQLESPHVYIAVLGPDRDIAGLWQWAASSNDWEAGEDLYERIKQQGQPWSDMCPR
jgi:heat shock protein HslJ